MEMRTDKFMIYVFSAIMLGGMVACSSDDPETDTGNGNGNGGNAEAPYVWGAEGAIKTCDHLLFDDDKTENAKGTVIGNGDQEFIFKGTQTLSKGTYLMKGWIYVGTGSVLTIEPGTVIKGDLSRGDQLAVLGGEVVFLGHLVQDLRREGFLGDLGVEEHQLAVFLAQLFAVGGRQQGGAPGILALLDLWGGSVPEIHLIIVEFISGIDGIADAGQVGQRVYVLVQGLFVQKGGLGGSVVRRGGKTLGHSSKLRLDLVQVRALIGHLRKFHERISPLCVL